MDQPKKVLIDAFPLLMATSGVKTYTVELCAAAAASKDPAFSYMIRPKYQRMVNATFFKGKLPVWKRLLWHLTWLGWKQLALPVFCAFHRVDALICTDFVVPMVKSGALKVAVMHDAFYWQYPDHYASWWRRLMISLIRNGLRGRAVTVTTSHYARETISHHLKVEKPMEVVYQCGSGFRRKTRSHINQTQFPLPEAYILHVGFFDRRKNIPTLLRAFKQFKAMTSVDYRLVLAGARAANFQLDDYDTVTGLIEELELTTSVIMPGYVPDEALVDLYQGARMYVFPSANEGFGIPVLEAMSFGVPVIVSDSGALKETGGDAVLKFRTFEPADLAEKMLLLDRDPNLRKKLSAAGAMRVKCFTREQFFLEMNRVILQYV